MRSNARNPGERSDRATGGRGQMTPEALSLRDGGGAKVSKGTKSTGRPNSKEGTLWGDERHAERLEILEQRPECSTICE